jgi:biopolymer transport protein ExbB
LDAVRSAPCASAELISKVAESEGARQSDLIQGQTQWLLEIATIAPMVGLLGTVMGMLSAFGAVASDLAAAKPTLLAEGVSQAIITTIFGLFVAIPAMMMYAFFRRRAAKLVATLESACAELVAVLTSRHAQD